MPQKVTDAFMPGFKGPFYPEGAKRINNIFRYHWPSAHVLIDLAKKINFAATLVLENLTTSDNYTWLCVIKFSLVGWDIFVFFPRRTDNAFGSPLDRSVAFYCSSNATALDVSILCDRFAETLETGVTAVKVIEGI